MARTIWKGALSFGLVNVPVGLYPATQDKNIHFNQLEAGTSDRIRYRKVNERTGQEVEPSNIVKGFDLGGGEYVLLSDDELAAAEPEKSRLIEITDFVDLEEIDPIFFRSTYYLAPEGEAAVKAYALLRQVMDNAHKVAIGTLVMRNKEYPVAIRPGADVLRLETLYFADEIRSPARELPELPGDVDLSDREISMAQLLLESMQSEWSPDKYHDTHRQKVEALIDEKRQGHQVVVQASSETAPPQVVDLMEVLSASIDSVAARRRSTADTPTGTTGTRHPAAKKPVKSVKSVKANKAPAAKAPAAKKSAPRQPARRKAS